MVNLRYISNSGDGAVVIATSLYRALSQSHPAGHLVRNWRGEMPIHLAAKGYVRGVQMHGPFEDLYEERGIGFQLFFVVENDGGVISEAEHV